MDGFDIATDRIATAATGVDGIAGNLKAEIATMEGLLGDISVGWRSSSAAPRFVSAMHGYLDDARRLTTALLSHSAGLAATGKAFDEAEQAVAAATPGAGV